MNSREDSQNFEDRLNDAEDALANFAILIEDGRAREAYTKTAKAHSETMRNLVRSGRMSAREAAHSAVLLRNEVMEIARRDSSILAKRVAEFFKEHGRSIEQMHDKYALSKHGRPFASLASHLHHDVHLAVIEASGRTNPLANTLSKAGAGFGGVLILLSLAHSTKNVMNSRQHTERFYDELSGFLGGYLGGELGAIAGRYVRGPIGILFIGAGMCLGGYMGVRASHDYVKPYIERSTPH